jgi:CBS domain-containing protein
MMFWVGVMLGRPKDWEDIHKKMDFRDAKKNFFNAARYGMAAQFHWGEKIIPTKELILEHFLPMAYKGLSRASVSRKDAEHYLGIIQNRINTQNGSEWMVKTYRELRKDFNAPEALRRLTASLFERSYKGYPVDAWRRGWPHEHEHTKKKQRVGDLMSTKIITAQEEDSAALVIGMMKWNDIHHLPILNNANELVGMLTWNDVEDLAADDRIYALSIQEVMRKNPKTLDPETLVREAEKVMSEHNLEGLPVVAENILVGILTSNDIK